MQALLLAFIAPFGECQKGHSVFHYTHSHAYKGHTFLSEVNAVHCNRSFQTSIHSCLHNQLIVVPCQASDSWLPAGLLAADYQTFGSRLHSSAQELSTHSCHALTCHCDGKSHCFVHAPKTHQSYVDLNAGKGPLDIDMMTYSIQNGTQQIRNKTV